MTAPKPQHDPRWYLKRDGKPPPGDTREYRWSSWRWELPDEEPVADQVRTKSRVKS